MAAHFLAEARDCPVISDLMVPESIRTEWIRFHEKDDLIAFHRSVALLAYRERHLRSLTSPLHRMLIENGLVREDLTCQYRRDLREDWFTPEKPEDRHERYREFNGKLMEVLFADWLRSNGWSIRGLEATGAVADVIAANPDHYDEIVHWQVKYLGASQELFKSNLAALSGGVSGAWQGIYGPRNALICRIAEGAHQFAQASRRGNLAIIIGSNFLLRS